MSIAAAAAGERAVSDQARLVSGSSVASARRITPKADPTLIPERR